MASAASLILRVRLRWEFRYVCLTYCWVMVDAPWRLPDPATSDKNARTMLIGLRAPSVKKCRSSVETTALMTTGGTWLRLDVDSVLLREGRQDRGPGSSYTNVV